MGPGIVILRSGALGDHILTLPAIRLLRQQHAGRPLFWVGDPSRGKLARPDHLEMAEGPLGRALFGSASDSLPGWIRKAKRILVYSSAADALVQRLRGVCSGHVSGWDPRPPQAEIRHIVQHLASPVMQDSDLAGLSPDDLTPTFSPTASEVISAQRRWSEIGVDPAGVVVLHAGSGGRQKCWPVDRFVAVGDELQRQGRSVAVLVGPVESERPESFNSLMKWPVISAADPVELASLLSLVRCLIGNDSGPAHVAAAVGTPTLALFGPTDPRRWRPLGERAIVVASPTGDMGDLSIASVIDAALDLTQSPAGSADPTRPVGPC